MRNKLHFKLILVLMVLLIIIAPNYSNAISAVEILQKDLTAETMETLKDWHDQMQNNGGPTSDAVAKILNEVKIRLASSSIYYRDICIGLEIWGYNNMHNLTTSTLTNLKNILSSYNESWYPQAQIAYRYVTECLDERNSKEITIDPSIDPDYYTPTEGNSTRLTSIGKTILSVINVVGVVVAVVALAIIGLRYMFGSVEERANYKETMVPYIVGLVMLGGITSIVNIIYNLASNIGK